MIIQDYRKGDEKSILKLFKVAFKKEMDINYWTWRFQQNPAGNHFIKLMWLDDLLIGHYAVSPVKMNVFGKEEITALSMTTMTHPEHSGKGIFNKLALSLYEELENQRGFKFVWGFPNINSHYGFIKNLEWSDIGIIHNLAKSLSNNVSGLSDNVTATKEFSNTHVKILSELSSGFKISILKDMKYLNWRYILNPSQDYTIFDYNDRKQDGFIVAKIYPSNTGFDLYDLYIMELGIKKHQLGLLNIILDHVVSYYNVKFDRVNIWLNLWDERHIVLEKMGFNLDRRSTFLGIRNNTGYEDVTILKNWGYSFGDSDVY